MLKNHLFVLITVPFLIYHFNSSYVSFLHYTFFFSIFCFFFPFQSQLFSESTLLTIGKEHDREENSDSDLNFDLKIDTKMKNSVRKNMKQ